MAKVIKAKTTTTKEELPITFILRNENTGYKYKIKLNCIEDVYYELGDD